MRVGMLAAIVSMALLNLSDIARAQQNQKIPNTTPAWNDNALIEIQKRGGDPAREGDVGIEFYGHDAFKITSPEGLSVLTDPWRNDSTGAFPKWFLRDFPAIQVDVVLSTHAHFDHDAVTRPRSLMVLDRLAGDFKLGDVEIAGLADKHKCDPTAADNAQNCPPNNVMSMDNAIQVIQTGGLRIAVWGDNRASPDAAWDRSLKGVDLLIVPVEAVLTRAEAEAVVERYDPKAVIPSHYFVSGLTTKTSGVESVGGWVSEQEKNRHVDVRRLSGAELTLNSAALKDARHRIYYFGEHASLK
jgi:L-ascorbate metabolism protein UlaG (beta-lactamase superfamily)